MSYNSLTQDANLELWLKFEGNLTDSGPNGITPSWVGGAAYSTGKFGGQCASFVNTRYITLSDTSLDISGDITVAAWGKTATINNNFIAGFYNTVSAPYAGYGLGWRVNGADKVEAWCGTAWRASTGTLTAATWHHTGFTNDGTNTVLYIDGSASGSHAQAHPAAWTGTKVIGAKSSGVSTFNGQIDDFFVFSRALSASEMAELAAGPEPLNTVAPVISGVRWSGYTLSCTTGTWNAQGNGTLTYAYQWKRDGVAISGATSSTYTLVLADVGTNVTCEVTASNDGGAGEAQPSNTFAIVDTDTLPVTPYWHFDASVDAGALTLSGSNVTAWADISGNAFNPTITGSPTVTNINGVRAVQFGSGKQLNMPAGATSGLSDASVFCATVSLGPSNGNLNGNWLRCSSSAFAVHFGGNSATNEHDWYASFGSSGRPQLGNDVITSNVCHIAGIKRSANTLTPRLNGSALATASATVGWSSGALIGHGGGSYPYNGIVGELVFFNRNLSSDETTAVESYLTTKWKSAVTLGASAGSFTLTGNGASFTGTMIASAGSHTLTGVAASFRVNVSAATGAFTQAGSNAAFALTMAANVGAVSLASGDTAFSLAAIASAGSFTTTGSDASFAISMPSDAGSLVLAGSDAAFTIGIRMQADVGSFAMAGGNASFAHSMAASAGAFTLVGNGTGVSVVTLECEAGSFTLDGGEAGTIGGLYYVMMFSGSDE